MELYADERKDTSRNVLTSIFWEGGSNVDGFLTAAAAQVCTL